MSTETIQERLNKAILYYDDGNYQEVIKILNEVITNSTISLNEEINARTYLAFSYVAIDNRAEAKRQFILILKKKKLFSLNPEFVSPKIIEVYKEAERMVKKPTREKIIKIRKPPPTTTECLVKSALLPGWGQITKREEKKGKLLIGAFSVSIAGLALSHLAYLSARNNYMNAVTTSDIEYQYSRYNFTYKTRYAMMEITLFVWFYGLTDILLTEPQGNRE